MKTRDLDTIVLVPLNEIKHALAKYYDATVVAGFPSPAQDYMESEIDLPQYLMPRPASSFVIRVKGDSMIGAFIRPDEALLIIDRSLKPESGKIILAVINGEMTVKRLAKTPRSWVLHAENPAYRPITITPDMDFKVWGVVTWIINDAK